MIVESCETQASLRILETVAEFEDLRDPWSAWCDGPEADLDFFLIHLRHTPGVVRPYVMVVYRSGRPDCILVGWLEAGSVPFRVGSLTLFRPHARILRFVNGGFLGNRSPENSRILLGEILRSLRNHEAHTVEFSQLRTDSPLYDLARHQPNLFCREHFRPVQTHRFLTLTASFDEFFRTLSGKQRRQLSRNARLLERDFPGNVRFQNVRDECDVEDFARKADEISQKTYQRKVGAGFVNNFEMQEILRAAAKKKVLRASILCIGERPIAFASGFLCNKTLYGNFTGYSPEFKKYGPGLQALMRLFQESFEPSGSLLRIDSGCGDLPFKRAYFNSSWDEGPVWIFAPSAKGFGLHILRLVSALLQSLAMWLLAKCEFLRKLKKIWQRQPLPKLQCKIQVSSGSPVMRTDL